MNVTTDFGLDPMLCVVCGEPLFLDHAGEHYICMKGCRRIKRVGDKNEIIE